MSISCGIMEDSKTVVVITGASTGFGRLTAELLARRGCTVFATMRKAAGRNAGAAEEIQALAKRESLDLHAAEMDVTEGESVERCVGEVIDRAGRIDVLVNNAGFGYMGLMESFTIEQAQRIFDTNVFGVLRTIRAVLPQMHRQREGLLIQVSSGAGRVVMPSMGLYSASKFALEALTEAYRYELASVGIDSVCLEPGAYPTAIFGKIESGADKQREEAYASAREIAPRIGALLTASTADPMEIAEAIHGIIETPAGSRALRYRVGTGAQGVETINSVCAGVQEQMLMGFGVADLTTFQKPGRPAPNESAG
jgi:NAD(P)-dependent dehydrogenase (short-subunit alcohol dehydrogenase family)